ncbi:uncharacterized protein C13orf42 [Carcharodon carcharias]|uniref:uncharacterized protein C13orf42 n=1 Tax=Carcharodon carcharias TaxID=13397 RepID=UPI001B7DC7AE|nr:uncharacterized protein C13orf42 [Carcharodon carcharias]
MLKKLNLLFRPQVERKLGESQGNKEWQREESGIRLVRSTSLYLIGESHQNLGSSLKRSQSAISVDSSIYHIKAEDRVWMFSRTQDCLQYLQDLIVLRQKYRAVSNLNKPKENKPDPSSASTKHLKSGKEVSASKHTSKKPKDKSNPAPVPAEADTLAYFDSVIADFDQESKLEVQLAEDTHLDVDFVIATSTSEHSLHSNWILKSPRRYSIDVAHLAKLDQLPRRHSDGVRMSFKRFERRPMYLPKLVESPIHTLRFKPKARNEDDEF